jgi:hypothetical protein
MEILTKKRKHEGDGNTSKYHIFHAFCILEKVTYDDVQQAADILLEHGRLVRLDVDWQLIAGFLQKIEESRQTLRVGDQLILKGIANALEKLMLFSPAIFNFCMFSALPNDMIHLIIQEYAKDGGNLRIRLVCGDLAVMCEERKIFPSLKYIPFAWMPEEKMYHLFLLHFGRVGRFHRVNLGTIYLTYVRNEAKLKRRIDSPPFLAHPKEVLVLSCGEFDTELLEIMAVHRRGTGEGFDLRVGFIDDDPMDFLLKGSFSDGGVYRLSNFLCALENPAFKRAIRNLFIKYRIDPQ